MTRTPHAFAAAENRVDRGKTKERAEAQRLHFAEVAKSTWDGVLGGYGEHLYPDIIDALLKEGCARRKAASDGPAVAAVLGAICATLCGDLLGPKKGARAEADKAFKTKTGEAA